MSSKTDYLSEAKESDEYEDLLMDPSIPMLETTDGKFIHYGQWFGFPVCCHRYFWYQRDLLLAPMAQEEETLGFVGTGYRPCPNCLKLTPDEIYRGICERRWADLPFPVEPDSFKDGVMDRRSFEHIEAFAARMKQRGVVLDSKLSSLIEKQRK